MVAAPPPPVQNLADMPWDAVLAHVAAQSFPPVEKWNPEHCSDGAMRIAADGSWYHDGGRINRPEMVRLFASILRREADGSHALVTPGELVPVTVEDQPFLAVEARSQGTGEARTIAFRLNTGDIVLAGPDHPIRFAAVDGSGEPDPVVVVRGSGNRALLARIARPVFYDLVEHALTEDADAPVLWSGGARFPLTGSAAS